LAISYVASTSRVFTISPSQFPDEKLHVLEGSKILVANYVGGCTYAGEIKVDVTSYFNSKGLMFSSPLMESSRNSAMSSVFIESEL